MARRTVSPTGEQTEIATERLATPTDSVRSSQIANFQRGAVVTADPGATANSLLPLSMTSALVRPTESFPGFAPYHPRNDGKLRNDP